MAIQDANREVPLNSETTVKSTSADKLILDQILECLKLVFDCKVTSPKMYNDEKDVFFQYVTVTKKGGY